jgi:hypothetical protein
MLFDGAARTQVVELASGRPYLARLICHHATLSALNARRDTVTQVDIAEAIDRSVHEIESRLNDHAKLIAKARLASHPQEILALARASLVDVGEFEEGDAIAQDHVDGKFRALVDELLASGDLVITSNDLGHRRYRFAEDGLPSFLLLAAARSTGASSSAPEPKSRAEEAKSA